jgi:nucleotidyltransferase/DNA polymerase involved in DNA repair
VHRWRKTPDEKKLPIKTIFVKLKTHDFETKTIDRAFTSFASFEEYINLFEDLWSRVNKDIRLLGLGIRFEEENSLRAKQESFPV